MIENVILLLICSPPPHLSRLRSTASGEVLMSLNGWLQIALFIALILLLAKPMGSYMTRVFDRRRTWLDPVLVPCERLLYRLTGVDPDEEMRWTQYAVAMLIFSAATLVLTYAIERLQQPPPAQPAASRRRCARPRLQHRHLLHHQHQLAGLHARDHHELSHPDARPRYA